MKTSSLKTTLALGILAAVPVLQAQMVFDATADFSITNGNPNGVWSYGWMPVDFSQFNLLTNGTTAFSGSPGWHGWNGDGTPGIWKNLGVEGWGVPTGFVSVHPGPGEEPAVLRWTSPVPGAARIQGRFLAGDSGTMQVAVRKAETVIWQAPDWGEFELLETVSMGDTVDFAVYGGYGCGNTPLQATVTLDPYEPNQPPRIWTQPVGHTNFVGETVLLNVWAYGSSLLNFQWLRGEAILDGATNRTFATRAEFLRF
jgi:hypothetical protein